MFGLFKRKTEQEKLQAKYEKLLREAHELSTINRTQSDVKVYEAEQVMKELEKLLYP